MLSRHTVDRLRKFEGNGSPVVSVYINLNPDIRELRSIRPRLKDMLKPVRALIEAPNVQRAFANSLRDDVEAILGSEKRIEADLGHGVAMFASSGAGFFDYLSLPRTGWDVAIANAAPYLRPLDAMLDEFHYCCVVVVDQRRSWLYESFMDSIEERGIVEEEVQRKNNYAGWYGLAEYGTQRRAQELSHRHYRETAKAITDLFASSDLELLMIGGHREASDALVPFLPVPLREAIAGTFVVDPGTMTPATVHAACRRLQDDFEAHRQRDLCARLSATADSGGHAAMGLAGTLQAANAKAINLLLVESQFTAPGTVCERCRWLGLWGDRCEMCGAATRATPDIIDEVAEATLREGGKVRHVSPANGLPGTSIGAMLRFSPAA
ncbi:MAG: hypothetical protein WDA27_12615 [Actinomycetota bacterium]